MKDTHLQLLLADDDKDDCDLFRDALDETAITATLDTVHDGEQLMRHLTSKTVALPQILFLDLNMPKKNGFECLAEIKNNDKLKHLPVIVFSTSFNHDIVSQLYTNGAHYYISKPNEFEKLKTVIQRALFSVMQNNASKPRRENFVLQP
jgi:CheY-like chemotaxis protein